MKILGIDPALGKIGWGVIEIISPKIKYIASGTITTKPDQKIHKRLSFIAGELSKVIDLYNPAKVAMEETFVSNNAVSSLKLGYARGAIMSMIGQYDLPFFEYPPNRVKKSIVGVGHAEKQQIQHMLKIILSGAPEKFASLDESDALAIAYTCFAYEGKG